MTLRQRRWLYLFLIILFLIVTPLILFYSLGYRFNYQLKKIQLTGAMYLRSKPIGSEIFLNNKTTGIVTPNKITNLVPGDYQVKIAKAGYYPWEKKLNVTSFYTTFAEDIYLFKESPEGRLIFPGQIENFLISPSGKMIYYTVLEKNFYNDYIYYFSSQQSEFIKKSPTLNKYLSWSLDEQKILFQDDKDNYNIFDLNNIDQVVILDQLTKIKFSSLTWDDTSSNLIWGLANEKLYQIDLLNQKIDPMDAPALFSLLPSTEGFYIIYRPVKNGSFKFALADFKKFEHLTDIGDLPSIEDYQLEKIKNWLFIYSPTNKFLYFLKYSANEPIAYNALKNINGYAVKGDQLLYWNDFEYWVFNLKTQDNQLIERLSTPLDNVSWHPDANYLLVETEKQLKIIELDGRDHRNYYNILKADSIIGPNLAFSPNYDFFIFPGSLNNKPGLYSLTLQ